MFTIEGLLRALLDDSHGNRDAWMRLAVIVPEYMPPYPDDKTRPSCVVRVSHGDEPDPDNWSYLRHSSGPRQGHFWDCYGDDYLNPNLALIALLKAPPPPPLLVKEVWERRRTLGLWPGELKRMREPEQDDGDS